MTPTQGEPHHLYPCPYGPCANGGLSDRVRTVTIVDSPGMQQTRADGLTLRPPREHAAPTEQAPAVTIVPGNRHGLVKCVPALWNEHAGCWQPFRDPWRVGPMMGGAHLAPVAGMITEPVPIHDRWEDPTLHNALSQ